MHAESGEQVIKFCRENPSINLVLMDIKMPGMSGIDALIELRKRQINIPVIAQTAYAMSDELIKLQEVGFNDYISKPIKPKDFYILLNKYF